MVKMKMVALFLGLTVNFAFAKDAIDMKKWQAAFARPKSVPYLDTNPYTKEKEELGKMLYFEPRLSKSGQVSCATCHNPSFSWGDGLAKAVGSGHLVLGRKSPTVINLAWTEKLMWDGRFNHLEGQALGPITSPGEMNMQMDGDDGVLAHLGAVPEYRKLFAKAFPKDPNITADNLARAIAIFERGIVSGEAPFDKWLGGNEKAISDSAKKGFQIFVGKGNCVTCHSGWKFSDDSFHDIGLNDDDIGRGKYLKLTSQQHAFKTPGLRNIAQRAPYLHNGSEKTLKDVIEFYNLGGKAKRDSLAAEIKPLNLTDEEKMQLEEFLLTLTGKDKPMTLPTLPVASVTVGSK